MAGAEVGWMGQKNPWSSFQTVDNRQHNTVIPEKQTKWALQLSQLTTRREFPGHGTGMWNLAWAQWSRWLEEAEPRVWEAKEVRVPRKENQEREESAARERAPESCGGPPESSALFTTCMWGNFGGWGKNRQKGASRTILRALTGEEYSPCSHQPEY